MSVELRHFESELLSTLSRGCTSSKHSQSLLNVVSFLVRLRCLMIDFKMGKLDLDSNSFLKPV